MAYLVRRLLGNARNGSFIRHRFAGGRTLGGLVARPAAAHLPEPADAAERPGTDPADPGPFANEPHAELRRAHVRARLEASVTAAPARLGFEAPAVFAGRAVPTPAALVSRDPGHRSPGGCPDGPAGPAHRPRAAR